MRSNNSNNKKKEIDTLVRSAILITLAGMILVLIFLIFGFRSWSVGIGVFMGMPVMIGGVVLYIITVIRDLKERQVLDEENAS